MKRRTSKASRTSKPAIEIDLAIVSEFEGISKASRAQTLDATQEHLLREVYPTCPNKTEFAAKWYVRYGWGKDRCTLYKVAARIAVEDAK